MRYWLHLVFLAAALLIAIGTILQIHGVSTVGIVALALAVAAMVAQITLRDYLAGGSGWRRLLRILKVVAGVLALGVFGIGIHTIYLKISPWFR
jgi:type VI protein secretion system component VasK